MDELDVHGGNYSDEDVVQNLKSRAGRKKVQMGGYEMTISDKINAFLVFFSWKRPTLKIFVCDRHNKVKPASKWGRNKMFT